jgi:hypothetical protein
MALRDNSRCWPALRARPTGTAAALAALTLAAASAIPPRIAAQAPPAPSVGDVAPDFTLPGATRYGLLRDPVTLSHFRGKTVVLAFFFKARTKG